MSLRRLYNLNNTSCDSRRPLTFNKENLQKKKEEASHSHTLVGAVGKLV